MLGREGHDCVCDLLSRVAGMTVAALKLSIVFIDSVRGVSGSKLRVSQIASNGVL